MTSLGCASLRARCARLRASLRARLLRGGVLGTSLGCASLRARCARLRGQADAEDAAAVTAAQPRAVGPQLFRLHAVACVALRTRRDHRRLLPLPRARSLPDSRPGCRSLALIGRCGWGLSPTRRLASSVIAISWHPMLPLPVASRPQPSHSVRIPGSSPTARPLAQASGDGSRTVGAAAALCGASAER